METIEKMAAWIIGFVIADAIAILLWNRKAGK